MKRILSIVLCALMIISLAGCGSAQKVPDKTIERLIENFVNYNPYYGEYEYSYSVSHDPDKSTNSDTIQVDLKVTYPHAAASSQYKGTYQYDKASGVWNEMPGGEWEPLQINSYRIPDSPDLWLEAVRETRMEATIIGQGREFGAEYVEDITQGRDLAGSAVDGWEIYGASEEGWTAIELFAAALSDEQSAQVVYAEAVYRMYYGQADSTGDQAAYSPYNTGAGDHYAYCYFRENTGDPAFTRTCWAILRIDNMVYTLSVSDEDSQSPYFINMVLHQIGFDPPQAAHT